MLLLLKDQSASLPLLLPHPHALVLSLSKSINKDQNPACLLSLAEQLLRLRECQVHGMQGLALRRLAG